MILFRFLIVSALLYASANATLGEVFDTFSTAVKSNLKFLSALSSTMISAPLKLLSPLIALSPIQIPPIFGGQHLADNMEEQLKQLQALLESTAEEMGTQDVQQQQQQQ